MVQKSLIDFCAVSSNLFSEVLDVRAKRYSTQLSTTLLFALYDFQNHDRTENRVDAAWLTGSNGRPWWTEM